MLPTLSSLDKICRAFDMTLAQFLSENDGLTEITPDQRELLDKWELLSPIQKKAFLTLMDSIAL